MKDFPLTDQAQNLQLSKDTALLEEVAATRVGLPTDHKIARLSERLTLVEAMADLSLQEFEQQSTLYKERMLAVGQSVVDICHTILMEHTGEIAHSFYSIIDQCERLRILPTSLVAPLAALLVVVDRRVGHRSNESIHEMHQEVRANCRVFRRFLVHVEGRQQKDA